MYLYIPHLPFMRSMAEYVCKYMYTCKYIYVHVCMYMCVCACTYVCKYICLYLKFTTEIYYCNHARAEYVYVHFVLVRMFVHVYKYTVHLLQQLGAACV